MKKVALLFVAPALFLLSGCSDKPAAPPANDAGGVQVTAPGVDVKTDPNGVQVKTPGADVNVEHK
jgi:hypothetical protein